MNLGPSRLLVVDDNEMNRDMLARRLTSQGFDVGVASGAEQLLERVGKDGVDLVLLDVAMPGISGLEALTILRQSYAPIELPIIMVTAKNESEDIVKALSLGANDYVTKPIDFPVALARIRTQLSHKRAEEQILYQQTLLKCQIEASVDGILLISPEGKWLSHNQRFLSMWSIPEAYVNHGSESQSLRWMMEQVADPEEFQRITMASNAGDERGTPEEILLKNGHTFECYSAPIKSSSGTNYGRVWYYRDITARKWSERALRESEERYSLAARGANDGLWDWNLTANVVYFSPRWKNMLGYEEGEIGDSLQEWFGRIHAADRERVQQEIAAHQNGLTPHFESEYRMLHKDSSFRWMLSRGLAVHDASGNCLRMSGSQTDITTGKVADALTGLPNRLLFTDRLGRLIESAKRHKDYSFAVLSLDLDGFKLINDSLGHLIGDQLLVEVANRLEKCFQLPFAGREEAYTVARLSGDQFSVLLDDLDKPDDATQVADRIMKELTAPFNLSGKEVFTSASIGIAISNEGYDQAEDLMRDADTAKFRAKFLGKARYVVFDASMRVSVIARLQLETDLRRALERGEFRNYYQPIISLDTGRIVGFEALTRWQHPARGLLQPVEFIPVAEETGLIRELGWWNLSEACRQIIVWNTAFDADRRLFVSVNLSAKQLLQPKLVAQIRSLLQEMALPPETLKLEITESTVMADPAAAVEMLMQIKALGIRLAIDDFGTGYSSLSYLHRFPLDTLKIDRSFIMAMTEGGESLAIVRTILPMANNLRLDAIAEGVETAEQVALLKKLRCEFAQGYYFSKPVTAQEAGGLLAGSQNWPENQPILKT